MRISKLCRIIAVAAIAAACSDQALLPTSTVAVLTPANAKVSDPTATWMIPLDATGLAFQSDGLYGNGTYSVYANGICTVSTTIFVGGSGDATIQANAPKGHVCGREFKYVFPDGSSETVANYPGVFNLTAIENSTFSIPIGTTMPRHLNLGSKTARCGGIHFGVGQAGLGVGSDSVLVTRVNATTWQVTSQAYPNDLALCENTGELMHFPVNFVVVSSRALP